MERKNDQVVVVVGVRKGAWTKDEDDLLRKCIENYGEGKWHLVPLRAGLNRCRKSCRLRWLNYLSPSVKRGIFNDDEVDLIVRLHKLLGNRSDTYPKDGGGGSSSSTTSVHVTALDGLVNVNSLFTIAVFVGLSLTTPGQHSLENPSACDAGVDVAKKLLVFEVVSFSFFLFSSLVAQGLKLAINLLNSKDVDETFRAHINLKVLRFGMLASAVGSVMGCLFLMLSMVSVIEIRLGMLSCGSRSTVHSVTALIVLVTSALVVYISTAVYAFLH